MTTEHPATVALESLKLLGEIATSHPWEELRRVHGDEALRGSLERAARTWLDVIERTRRGPRPDAFPRPAEAERAFQQMLTLLPSLAMDDTRAVGPLRVSVVQALEALGFRRSG